MSENVLLEDDILEFTVIAGEDEQFSKTKKATAKEFGVVGCNLSNPQLIIEEPVFERYVMDCNYGDFLDYHGSVEEFGETQYSIMKVIRNEVTYFEYNSFKDYDKYA